MKQLRVGFSRVNIDPKHGIPVRGYYVPRFSSGILDHIYANAVVFAMDEKTVECQKYNPDTGRYVAAQRNDASGCVALISVDNCGLTAAECRAYRQKIHEQTGVPFENIIIHCTHTHTGPNTTLDDHFDADARKVKEYAPNLKRCVGHDGARPWAIVDRAIELGAEKVQLYRPFFNKEMVDKAHANGIICNVFFADDIDEAKRYLDMGIDTILTNDYHIISQLIK